MSNKYIVRQPIKDCDSKIIGYEILYYGENQAFADMESHGNEFAAADTIYNFLLQNSSKLFHGTLNFMTFTPTLIMKKTPRLFAPSELVIQIDDSVIIHPLAMHLLQQYSKEGYKIAVNEFQFQPRYLALLDGIDYIKLNMPETPDSSLQNLIEIAHSLKKQCIATGISNEQDYQRALNAGVDALEGSYVAEKLSSKTHTGSYLQSNFFRLIVAVTKDEPDLADIVQLISVDATLSYALLRLANSPVFAPRHRITTIQQAIMTLGLNQLKQWVYLLSASTTDTNFDASSEEFLKLSFMRANFCSSLVQYAPSVPLNKSDAYLMGMFSTLHHLIDAPLEEILSEVPVPEEVKQALLERTGPAGVLFELVLSYEHADWNEINAHAAELNLPTNVLTSVYFNCMEEVNTIWKQLSEPAPPIAVPPPQS